jgi:hypothetical protein
MGPDTPPIRICRADVAPTNDERYSVQGVYARNMKSYHLTLREQFQREYGVKYLYVRFFGSYAYFYFEDDNDEALRDLVTSHVALRMFRPELFFEPSSDDDVCRPSPPARKILTPRN